MSGQRPPMGFWCYSSSDEPSVADGLREQLEYELRLRIPDLRMFDDRDERLGGHSTAETDRALAPSAFLVPIITPNFLQSEECQREVRLFGEYGRLIFPIYLEDIGEFGHAGARFADATLALLDTVQWTDLRSGHHRRLLSELAQTIATQLNQPPLSSPPASWTAVPSSAFTQSSVIELIEAHPGFAAPSLSAGYGEDEPTTRGYPAPQLPAADAGVLVGFTAGSKSLADLLPKPPRRSRRRFSFWFALLPATAVIAWIAFRVTGDFHQIVTRVQAVIPLFGLATRPRSTRNRENAATLGVYAPRSHRRGYDFLVQAVLCPSDVAINVGGRRAKAADPGTVSRGTEVLHAPINQGETIELELEARGQVVDEPRQSVIWAGRPELRQFLVSVDRTAEGPIHCLVRVLRSGVPIGSIRFVVTESEATAVAAPEPAGDRAQRYRRAFLSYASPDRPEVVKRAQTLDALQISFFQDILSLNPGEQWWPRLQGEIDQCDLFLLFWSSHARASEWVERETDRAQSRRRAQGAPDIIPIMLEGPPPPQPPDSMRDIHFNDRLIYFIAATLHEQQQRGGDAAPGPA